MHETRAAGPVVRGAGGSRLSIGTVRKEIASCAVGAICWSLARRELPVAYIISANDSARNPHR